MEVAERSLDGDVDDADVLVGFVGFGVNLGIRDPLDRLHAFDAASKHGVLVVQPGLQTQTGEAFRSPAKKIPADSDVQGTKRNRSGELC